MIAIIDYGMGNLQSVQKAFEHLGYKACLSSGKDKILNADKVVFPGVGAFKDCMHNLKEAHLDEAIFESIERKKPFLGICLGMQALLTESDEFGPTQGLNCIAGRVEKLAFENLEQSSEAYKIPHVGWNQIKIQKDSPLFKGIDDGSYFYFVHSYHVIPEDPKVVLTKTNYGIDFVSSVQKENLFAVQFHPEKSQELGLKLLKNFADL